MPEKKFEKPTSIADLAARLAGFGYWPVPIPAGSKGPTIAGWDALRVTPADTPALFHDAALVGCLHVNLGCFDIDVTDEALAAEIVAEGFRRFPRALERIGKPPKSAIVFRLDEPGYKVRNTEKHSITTPDGEVLEAQVEVRTLTRQMVVYGAHPETKKPYTWPRGELWATPRDQLPEVTEAAAQDFRDWCNERIRTWAGVEKPTARVYDLGEFRGHPADDRPSEAEFLEALSYVPATLSHNAGWLDGLMAIHDFYAGSLRGLEVAKNWSSSDSRFNPHEVEMKWRSFEVGKGISYRAVFHHAQRNGANLSDIARKYRGKPQADDLSADFAAAMKAGKTEEASFDGPRRAPDLEWFDDIAPSLDGSYLVKGMIDAGAMSVVYGPSNSGKTFFVLDLAYSLAIGAPWRGRRVKQCAVLYLAAEGGRGVLNRIAALKQEYGVCDVPLALKRAGLDLLHNGADLQHIADLAAEVTNQRPGLPLFLVIDTLSRIMAGGDENTAADMTALIKNIDAIREVTGAHIMLVHHTGKDIAKGARGHSSLRAATDTEIEVGNDNGVRAAMVTKQRDHQGGETFVFSLKGVTLGTDQDGDDVTSCVVVAEEDTGAQQGRSARKGIGGNQKIIADTFDQMLSEGLGKPNPGGVGLPDPGRFWTVQMDDLRTYSQGKMAASNKRGAFIEAWKGLTDGRGLFCAASDLVWAIDRKVK